MTAKFVRCIEGHVFDRAQSEICPVCGNPSAIGPAPDPAQDQDQNQIQEEGTEPAGFGASTSLARLPPWLPWAGTAIGSGAVVALLFILFAQQRPTTSSPTKTVSTVSTDNRPDDGPATKLGVAKDTKSDPAKEVAKPAIEDASLTKSDGPSSNSSEKRSADANPPPNPSTDKTGPQRSEVDRQRTNESSPRDRMAALMREPVLSTQLSATLQIALVVKRIYAAMGTRQFQTAAMIAQKLYRAENPVGALTLGRLSENGAGVPLDPAKARLFYSDAIRWGDANAAFALAYLLERGVGGEIDQSTANRLYLFAARNSVTGAEAEIQRLKIAQQRGSTVVQAYNDAMAGREVQSALRFLNAMLDAHSSLAHCAVAWLHINGKAVHVDLDRASTLMRVGATRGMTWCALGMAKFAKVGGPGVAKNLVEARVWYEYVRDNGNFGAQELEIAKEIAVLEQQMLPEAVTLAQKLFADSIDLRPVQR